MFLKKKIFTVFILVCSISFAFNSNLALDTLIQERMISLHHASLFSKVLTQDNEELRENYWRLNQSIVKQTGK